MRERARRGSHGAADGDPDAWAFDALQLDPGRELLTLALLEDLSALLTLHGYPALRGHPLAELTLCLQRTHPP